MQLSRLALRGHEQWMYRNSRSSFGTRGNRSTNKTSATGTVLSLNVSAGDRAASRMWQACPASSILALSIGHNEVSDLLALIAVSPNSFGVMA